MEIVEPNVDQYPLSPMQEGMLYQSLRAPNSGVDIEQIVMSLPEALDSTAFRAAWQALARRHDVLRTSFDWSGGAEATQIVHPNVAVPFIEEDLRGLPATGQQEHIDTWLRDDRRRGFELNAAPLFRVTVFRLGGQDYRVVWTIHHILMDGRSLPNVIKELFAISEALEDGEELNLAPVRPYRDFIHWYVARDPGSSKPFWRELMAGITAPTALAIDRSITGQRAGKQRFGKEETILPVSLVSSMRMFSGKNGLTMNTLIQGAWALLLARYSNDEDVVFGATRACRHSSVEGSEDIVGLFINTLPVRARVSADTDLLLFLKQLRAQALAVRPHEHTPLTRIREWCGFPPGDQLFESFVLYEPGLADDVLRSLGGAWAKRSFELHRQSSFPLSLAAFDSREFRLSLSFDCSRFDRVAIRLMLSHFETLLASIVSGRYQRVSEVPMLTEPERQRMLVEWNSGEKPYPRVCLHELFERQAERCPGELAAVFQGSAITYDALNRRANRIARQLRSLGAGAETIAGICADRSLDMLAGILGVLKAGAAYLPLDPAYPSDRLRFMLEDSGALVVLVQDRVADRLGGLPMPVIPLENAGDGFSGGKLEAEVRPEHLAYVLYTSGSTGNPKGVQVEHRSIVNYVLGIQDELGLSDCASYAMVQPLTVDSSVTVIYPPLVTGGCLHIISGEDSVNPEALGQYFERNPIDCLKIAPSHLSALLASGRPERIMPRRCLIIGGEASRRDWARSLQRLAPECRIINHYGPTEATVGVTVYPLRTDDDSASSTVLPIGRPLPNIRLYVLDQNMQPVPVGVPGGLYCGGECLARGYLNRADLTEAQFVRDPFSEDPSARLYKTGDLVRYLPDGNIEFIGRGDDQVKIRGFRVELGEVEAALNLHPQVREAAVTVHEGSDGQPLLAGYFVPRSTPSPTPEDLKRFLQGKLPGHMTPSAIIELPGMPRTPHGKLDRGALPAPDAELLVIRKEFVAPRNELEKGIAAAFSDVLGVEKIGIHDNFFDLGGHSLLAVRLIGRLSEALAVEMTVPLVFQAPTVAGMAEEIGRLSDSTAQTVPRRSGGGPAPVSLLQQRLWLIQQMEPESTLYSVPWVRRLRGELDADALRCALQLLVERHEILRTTYQAGGDTPLQVVSPAGPVSLVIHDLTAKPEHTREATARRLVRQDQQRRFDLSRALPFRFLLLKLSGREHILSLTIHHIATDGWSASVIAREIAETYAAFVNCQAPQLPELPIQYSDFAVWQREWLSGARLESQSAYWRKQLKGVGVLRLPTDRPRPPSPSYQGAMETCQLSASLIRRIAEVSRQESASPFMTTLAALQVLLHRYSGQDDFTVGAAVANRNWPETQGLIGFFVNTLVLRGDLSGDPTFRQLLVRTREAALGAYQHQDLPFDKLVEDLQPERTSGISPLFQVLFEYSDMGEDELDLPEVAVEPLAHERTVAKFDLTLTLRQQGEQCAVGLNYSSDLFDVPTARRMLRHLVNLLRVAVDDPDLPVSRVPILTPPEREQLLLEWSGTAATYDLGRPLHKWFEAQVERTPKATAVVFGSSRLTFRELNRRANRLARRLQSFGVGPDVMAGLFADRSLEMLAGLLGILKAGGAYVPLAPDAPAERTSFMLEDTGVRVIVTKPNLVESLPEHAAELVQIDCEAENVGVEDDQNVDGGAAATNLAYVIYTSGSTGKPKGVQVEHRPVVNYVLGVRDELGLGEGGSYAMVQPLTVDSSVTSIYPPLFTGGCLHIISREDSIDPAELEQYFAANPIDCLKIAPSHLGALLASSRPERLMPRRHLIIGGEASRRDWAESLRSLAPECRIFNHYGPTEATVGVTTYALVGKKDGASATTLPIGRPLPNTRLYILDRNMQPVPIGVPGELHCGGDCLARGYLNRADLTEAQFVRDPFGDDPAARLYKTGDFARYLPDGIIEFVGRGDDQVKIRGFRVELGEVEAALEFHPEVREAAVTVQKGTGGEPLLTGYFVPRSTPSPTPEDLKRFLQGKLPGHMTPSAIIELPGMPRTPHGKLDRGALPAPDAERLVIRKEFAAPRNELEKGIASAWSDVLGVEKIGIHDNFFDLGGHSLLAVRLIGRLSEDLSVELKVGLVFDAPTVAAMAAEIAGLGDARLQPIARRAETGPAPLSPGQEGLWFIHQLEPDSPLYNTGWIRRLTGALDVNALEGALTALVVRHEVLRTTYRMSPNGPVQTVSPDPAVPLEEVDLSELPEAEREEEARRIIRQRRLRPFNLSRGPILRPLLVRLAARDHILLLSTHHIATDVWSWEVIIRELRELYTERITGGESRLPALPIQYADFAVWQRSRLSGGVLEEQLAYWRKRLEGVSTLHLPTDRPRPAVSTHRGAMETIPLPASLRRRLQELSRSESTTLFMTCLAAYQALLKRYCGQDDIAVGTTAANRTRPETAGLAGYFVNSIVLRNDLSGAPSFRELLARVRDTTLGAFEHQDVPFEKLVEALRPQRLANVSPLFQAAFAFEESAPVDFNPPGLTSSEIEWETESTKVDLTLAVSSSGGHLRASLFYRTDLFEAATARRMLTHYAALLGAAAKQPDQSISSLPVLTRSERRQMLAEWNERRREYPVLCCHELFEQQAARTPDALAVKSNDRELTYAELNARANQLAAGLRKAGVGPEVTVGVSLDRSPEVIVSLLGIFKAGGAYLPLETSLPKERIAFMLKDARPRVVIGDSRFAAVFPEREAVFLDVNRFVETQDGDREDVASPATPEDLAYVIYTSGSTGFPRGVAVPHKALSNQAQSIAEILGLDSSDAVIQFSALSFDVSVVEIFEALPRGAAVVIPPQSAVRDTARLVRLLKDRNVTTIHPPPSLLRVLLDEPGLTDCRGLRRFICGGEPLVPDLLRKCLATMPADVYNFYGPTEATIFTSFWKAPRDYSGGVIPIGRPTANTALYVLDENLEPVPVGIPGELCIGGAGVARGYLNQPELTAERYVDDPFSTGAGARLYRSGDLVRYLPDGNIEFLGRIDHQVKIRGFRVEPGEVEAVLSQQPSVETVVVAPRESPAGDTRLVAWIVARGDSECPIAELRSCLKQKLPEYMTPSAFVLLEAMPLMTSGKIDLKCLPEPDWSHADLQGGYVPPSNDLERMLAGVWAEVLQVDAVGIHDSFFDLGGHSLLAVRLAARLTEELSTEIPVTMLFDCPTVGELAAQLPRLEKASQVVISRRPQHGAAPLSFAQQRLWFMQQVEPESSLYNITWARRLKGCLDVDALRYALQSLTECHEILRTTYQPGEAEPVQVVAAAWQVELPVHDLSGLPDDSREDRARDLMAEESEQPFDLLRGPIFRPSLVRLADDEHLLLLSLHHIAGDGWSLGVMTGELRELYSARICRNEPNLPGLPIQYSDYAVWQRGWLSGDVIERQLSYWRKQLEGVSTLQLPTDRPRPAVQSHTGARESLPLPDVLSERIGKLSRQEETTPFMTCLAAFQVLLQRYTGQDDIAVGSVIANRERPETQGLIGFLVNTLVLRSDLSGDPTFRQLVSSVRETALGAYQQQDLPFEKLVEVLRPERAPSVSPLFQVSFAYQDTTEAGFDLPGITVSNVETRLETAKFDLTLGLRQSGGRLRATFSYNTDLYDASTIRRMLNHFATLLEAAVSGPDERISRLPLLTEAERREMLVEWNAARTPHPPACVHELFEQQAAERPGEVAAVFEGNEITYGDLNRRANRIAHQLRRLGAGTETTVGICADRSLDMLAGMLGVLKSGAAYVPLDPAHPEDRLHFMLEDSGALLVLAQQSLMESFAGQPCPVIPLEAAGNAFPDDRPKTDVQPKNLAYIMYTSGSTGRPKGVEIEHRNVVAFLHSFQPFDHRAGRRVGTNVAPFCFDTSVEEIFGTICFGGTVHIMRPDRSTDARYFAVYLIDHDVNCSYVVPDMLEPVAAELAKRHGQCKLRSLVTGLAPKRERSLQTFRDLAAELRILNAYGPTEVTYGATAFEFDHAEDPDREVSIGRPFPNYPVYVVNESLQPVPVGVSGELLIGGAGVARGYRNRPELTAEKFIPDPFAGVPESRLYRTGDLVRYLPDGNLEFLGRIDTQLKIRGYRIEPGEIEAALSAHPAIERAAVQGRTSPAGDQRLVAYIVTVASQSLDRAELKESLRGKLPGYMAPSAFVRLDALPLMVNGKIDWNALPEPDWSRHDGTMGYVPPSGERETRMIAIWEDVLGVSPVGVKDNFFDLGGHSLLAVALFNKIEKEFQQTLPLSAILERQTVRELTTLVHERASEVARSSLVPLQPEGSRSPLFLMHANRGPVLFYRELAHLLGPDQPVYGLQSQGLDGDAPLLKSVEEMAAHYCAEIVARQPEGPYFLGGFCLGAYVALEMACQLQERGERVALLVSLNTDGEWRKADSLRNSWNYHVRKLVKMNTREKWQYIMIRLRFRTRRIEHAAGRVAAGVLKRLGVSLPLKLRDFDVFEANYLANVRYRPRTYDGVLTCLHAPGCIPRDPNAFWGEVALGGVEVHEISGQGEEIFQQPYVAKMAECLRTCLDKVNRVLSHQDRMQ